MEEGKARRGEEACPQLLDLMISKHRDQWLLTRSERDRADERSLELRLGLGLGPPGDAWARRSDGGRRRSPVLSLGNNTAVPSSTAQKRTAPAPVVGWPPIRSFRKNIASTSSSKTTSDSQNGFHQGKMAGHGDYKKSNESEKAVEKISRGEKGLFVKINMDGVPIGRKVDLKAYDDYQKLSSAVDILFRGLLAAQRDSNGSGIEEEEKAITGLLDGSGEYTLVYEDNEGDRMLVGDVPWNMFVSTVKRLRVLKSSELSTLSLVSGNGKQDQMLLGSSLK